MMRLDRCSQPPIDATVDCPRCSGDARLNGHYLKTEMILRSKAVVVAQSFLGVLYSCVVEGCHLPRKMMSLQLPRTRRKPIRMFKADGSVFVLLLQAH